jgi:hypothetical protein
MDKLVDSLGFSNCEARRSRRFNLEYPVRIKLKTAVMDTEIETVSKNVGIGGLLVRTIVGVPLRTRVTFILTLHGKGAVRPVHLVGAGEVVRVEGDTDGGFAIAVKCDTPISGFEEHLSM